MLLMFCLAAGPLQVKLHPNSLKHGAASVLTLRRAGLVVHAACEKFEAGTWRYAMTAQPAVAEIVPGPPGLKQPQCGGSTEEPAAKVIEILQDYWRQTGTFINPSKLPTGVWKTLEATLPRNGLKAFLLRHPHIFQLQTGTGNCWTFTLQPNDLGGAALKLSPTSGWAKQAEASGKHRDCSHHQQQKHHPGQHRQHKHHLHHHRICSLSQLGQHHLQNARSARENANGAQTSQISGIANAAKPRTP